MPRPPDLPKDWIYAEQTADDRPHPTCDFCAVAHPRWSYPCEAFVMVLVTEGGTIAQDFNGDGWAACDPCHALIAADARTTLALRASEMGGGGPGMLAIVAEIHANFFRHRSGSPGLLASAS
jgi:hypothetical protein